jgi:hypothetical protein
VSHQNSKCWSFAAADVIGPSVKLFQKTKQNKKHSKSLKNFFGIPIGLSMLRIELLSWSKTWCWHFKTFAINECT